MHIPIPYPETGGTSAGAEVDGRDLFTMLYLTKFCFPSSPALGREVGSATAPVHPFHLASTQETSCISPHAPANPGNTTNTFLVTPGQKKNPEKFSFVYFFKQSIILFYIAFVQLEGAEKLKL